MIEVLETAWRKSMVETWETVFFRRLREGSLDKRHYQALLREIYYNTRENPPSFAMMVWHLKGKKRDIAKRIYRHCAAEDGHHDLALADLRNLGVDVSGIPGGRPLPTTEAFLAFALYHVQHGNPLAYLGYVYHLEMLPAQFGREIISGLAAIGVPKEAMSFLTEHAHADEGHTKWMSEYVREAVETSEDLEAILHGVTGSCKLHGLMLQGIVESVQEDGGWSAAPGSESASRKPSNSKGTRPIIR